MCTADQDYTAVNGECTFTSSVTTCDFSVPILDDFNGEEEEVFNIILTSRDPNACTVQNNNISVTIMDDGKCTFANIHQNNDYF